MDSPFTIHAKERAHSRYGVVFSKKQWSDFGRLLDNDRFSIRLSRTRLACFFLGEWYLLGLAASGAVRTFLPRESISEDEKFVLRNNPWYRKIGNDAFHVLNDSPPSQAQEIPLPNRTVEIPDTEMTPEDSEAAKKLLDKAIQDKRRR